MRVLIAGTRGTAPLTGPAADPFGGDTTCVLVTGVGGEQVILDCGTGLPALAPRLGPGPRVLVLVTHYHLDHLAGLGTFAAAVRPRRPRRLRRAAAGRFHRRAGRARPARAALLAAGRGQDGGRDLIPRPARRVRGAPGGGRPRGALDRGAPPRRLHGLPRSTSRRPAPPSSSRRTSSGATRPPRLRDGFLALCREPRPADLLIHDGQFDAAGYAQRRGWGHATADDAVPARQGRRRPAPPDHPPRPGPRRRRPRRARAPRARPLAARRARPAGAADHPRGGNAVTSYLPAALGLLALLVILTIASGRRRARCAAAPAPAGPAAPPSSRRSCRRSWCCC